MAIHYTCDGCRLPVLLERFDNAGRRIEGQPLGELVIRRGPAILVQVKDLCPACIDRSIDTIRRHICPEPGRG